MSDVEQNVSVRYISLADATQLQKWVVVNPNNIFDRWEFDSVNAIAEHIFGSKELMLTMYKERQYLMEENERLRKAGDAMADALNGDYNYKLDCVEAWNAAKDGKPTK